jgi:hypothetical protein
MENPFASIVENQTSLGHARLSHEELCGYFAALKEKVHPKVVAKASGLSISTVCSLRAAGTFHAGQLRYPRVAKEYEFLGRATFIHRYVTPVLIDKIRVAADQVNRAQFALMTEDGGVNPRATLYAGEHMIAERRILIFFDRDPEAPGWKWRDLTETPFREFPLETVRGDTARQERGFPTSKAAFDYCRLRYAPTDAENDDGRAEAAWTHEDAFFAKKLSTTT